LPLVCEIFNSGHDTGLIVFKLERERPGWDVHNEIAYYISGKSVRAYNFTNANDIALVAIKRGHPGQTPAPRGLSYNPAEHSVMISFVNYYVILGKRRWNF
jgi:coatomer protein complex subunit alpha (xenin)